MHGAESRFHGYILTYFPFDYASVHHRVGSGNAVFGSCLSFHVAPAYIGSRNDRHSNLRNGLV